MNLSFNVTARGLAILLLKIIFLLLIGDLVSLILQVQGYRSAFGFAPLLDFDKEFNAPSLYSFGSMLLCGFLLRYIYIDKKNHRKQEAIHWKVLSYIFIYLSFDELMSLHERLGEIFHYFLGNPGGLNNSRIWIIPYAVLLLLFFLFFIRFFLNLPTSTKISFFIAGFIYVMGAVGVELFSGQFILRHPSSLLLYNIISIFEELLEMIGIVLFARSLVNYIAENSSSTRVNLALVAQERKR